MSYRDYFDFTKSERIGIITLLVILAIIVVSKEVIKSQYSDIDQTEYLKKIEQIIRLNKNYFDKNNPLVPDSEYDLLKKEILDLEKKYEFLNHKKSPSKMSDNILLIPLLLDVKGFILD